MASWAGMADHEIAHYSRRSTPEPIIPLDLFRVKLFAVCSAVAAIASMGVIGAVSYLPLYLQGVLGTSATHAGQPPSVQAIAPTAAPKLPPR